MALMRLDKYLSEAGAASRKELKAIIRAGRVSVDGKSLKKADEKIDTELSHVSLDGREISYKKYRYYMLDKPCGVVTATEDREQKTVIDLLSPEMKRMGLFPVGRLDKDTSGLLILTNDGEFAHKVISPRFSVEKRYYAEVNGIPDEADAKAFAAGLVLGDGTECLPAALALLGENRCIVTVKEGKYHQVRRMLASRGKKVTVLRRLSIGGLELDAELGEGGYKELVQDDLCRVFSDHLWENNQKINGIHD